MTMLKLYDALIVGGGPAGLSVALGLGRVHRSCVVFSHNKFRNDGAHASHATLTLDHMPPSQIRKAGLDQLERYQNTELVNTEITQVARFNLDGVITKEAFEVQDQSGQKWRGRTLVLAMGVKDVYPDLEGYAENWPENIYQCLFCDGHERGDLPKGILAYPGLDQHTGKVAVMAHNIGLKPGQAAEVAASHPGSRDGTPLDSLVTIFTNGPPNPANDPALASAVEKCKAHGIKVDARPVLRLSRASASTKPDSQPSPEDRGDGVYVHLLNSDGTESKVWQGYLVHKPITLPVAPHLISQLGLETKTSFLGGEVVKLSNDVWRSTSVPGVFAPGDVGSEMTNVTGAMMTGGLVAGGVTMYCADWDDEVALTLAR